MSDMLSSISTQVLPVILSIILALSGFCGTLPQSGVEGPVSVEIGAGLEGDISALSPDMGQAADIIKDIINSISIRFAIDKSAAGMQIGLKDSSLLSLSIKEQDDGWAAVSSLFPTTLLTVKNETLQQAGMDSASLLDTADPNAIAEAVSKAFEDLAASFKASAGEAETGAFTVNGVEYTVKVPYNITTKEAAALAVNTLKSLLANEAVAPLLAMFGNSISVDQLDSALESISNSDDNEVPALSAADYSNEAGDTCFEVLMENDGQSISYTSATSGAITTVTMSALGQADVLVVIDNENKQYDLTVAYASPEAAAVLSGSLKVGDDRSDLTVTVRLPMNGNDLAVTLRGAMTHDAPVFEAAEGLNTVAYEDLLAENMQGELTTALNTEMSAGVFGIIGAIMAAYPELFQTPAAEETTSAE